MSRNSDLLRLYSHLLRPENNTSFATRFKMRTLVKLLVILLVFKLILIALSLPFDLRNLLQSTSTKLHQLCLNSLAHLAPSTEAHATAQALVCGHEIENLDVRSLFASTGLIHLLVVSGSHLIIIKNILEFFLSKIQLITPRISNKSTTFIVFTLLFLYVLMCLMNPPVTRSYIGLLVAIAAEKWKFRWPPTTQQFFTSAVSIFINPYWLVSLSFQMSWLASLALNTSEKIFENPHSADQDNFAFQKYWQQAMLRTFLIYTLFIFLFCFFGFPHPLVPFYSIVLSPILELVLFPLAFAATLGTWFSFLYLNLFSCLTYLLNLLETSRPYGIFLTHSTVTTANLVLISVMLGFLIFLRKKST